MRQIFLLVGKELRLFVKDRSALALTFVIPVVLIYIFGYVFGVNQSGTSGPTGIPLAVVNPENSATAQAIVAALEKEKSFRVVRTAKDAKETEHVLTEAEVRQQMQNGSLRFALVFPGEEADNAFGVHVRFLNNPRNEIETQMVTGLVQKTIFTAAPQAVFQSLQKQATRAVGAPTMSAFNHNLAGAIAQAFGGDVAAIEKKIGQGDVGLSNQAPNDKASATGNFLDKLIKIDSEQVGVRQVKNPEATRTVGGWAMMFLLFSMSGAATSLFDEKKAGIFQRLLSTPVRRTHILWSKYLVGVIVGLVQLLVLFTAGHFLFGIDVTSNLGNLVLVCLAASIACVAFGMLLAAISPTAAAANGLGTFLILTMSAVGGAWFPTSFMPEFIQHLSRLTIVYWAIDGFLRVLYVGGNFVSLLPSIGVLLGVAAVVTAISVWRFNRGQIFD